MSTEAFAESLPDEVLPAFGRKDTAFFGAESLDYKPELSPDACLGSQSGFRMHAAKGIEIDDKQAACDDELIMASPCDRVAAVAEQLTDFLSSFPLAEQKLILQPFLDTVPPLAADPHIDEARQFVRNYLDAYSDADQEFALAQVSASIMNSRGSDDATSREFMSLRREARRMVAPSATEQRLQEKQIIMAVFQRRDRQGCGTIARHQLVSLLKDLNPSMASDDLESMLTSQWVKDPISYADFVAWICR